MPARDGGWVELGRGRVELAEGEVGQWAGGPEEGGGLGMCLLSCNPRHCP